jgi:hypothetical protein
MPRASSGDGGARGDSGGRLDNGCVADADRPGTSDSGTGRSLTSHTSLPASRSDTQAIAGLVV